MTKLDKTANFLDLVPERARESDKTGDGRTFLLVPRFKHRFMKAVMRRLGKSESVRVYLDSTGAGVWELVDGARSVAAIGQIMEKENGETMEQAYQRLSEFISILARNRFITLKNGAPGAPDAGG